MVRNKERLAYEEEFPVPRLHAGKGHLWEYLGMGYLQKMLGALCPPTAVQNLTVIC